MKFALAAAAIAAVSNVALAQTIQSKPFKLVTLSSNKKYNNVALQPCHEGAGIEGLCSGSGSAVYQFNTTKGQQSDPTGTPGVLTYKLVGGNFIESEPMSLYNDPSTNVAIALFEPGYDATYVAFDKKNLMNIVSYYNDTVSPPTDEKPTGLYRWYVCTTNYEGYVYNTLSWVYGKYAPQNPSCAKVDVKRVFTS